MKSPSEFIEPATEHARKPFETLTEQTKDPAALSHKAMLEAVKPLKAGAAKAFRDPLA